MHRMLFVLAVGAVASVGCATDSSATHNLAGLSLTDLAAPIDAAPESTWSEMKMPASEGLAQDTWASKRSSGGTQSRHITLMGGGRWLDEDEWEPFDSPAAYGLEVDDSDPASGAGYEVGVLYTDDDDGDTAFGFAVEGEVTTWELYGGYRHTFRQEEDGIHPFLSLGVGVENGEFDLTLGGVDDSDDDTIFGAYARLGLLWDLSERLRLGLDYRHFFAGDLEVDVFGTEVSADADYDQAMLTLGWAF